MIVEFAGLDADAALVADLDGVGRLVVRADLGAGQPRGAVLASGHVPRALRRVHPVVAHGDVALAERERVESVGPFIDLYFQIRWCENIENGLESFAHYSPFHGQ